ncbi:MAG: amino acid/amide transporter rane protein 1, family [Phycisphaerales bacterium]|nr:amino acid/amide transporter rane protein 1, family [Phycisphaerales bacterium]
MQEFLQQFVNGLSVGAIYALIAVGYTMVYGVLQLINFAHGDVFMVGAVLCLVLARAFGFVGPEGVTESWLAFGLVATLAVVGCGALGFLIERLAYRPLRDKPRINSLITAIGISLLLEYGAQHPKMFGATPQAFPVGLLGAGITKPLFTVAGVQVGRVDALVLGVALGLMLALSYVVLRTKQGLALRAVSFRFDTAALMGININRIISLTFVLGSVLAAVAGILYAVKYPKVEPLMGLFPGIKAFVAAVFGGIGNITGAVVAALLLGVIETMVVGYLPGGSNYKEAVAFVVLIAILLVKPAGLFGRNVVEKV